MSKSSRKKNHSNPQPRSTASGTLRIVGGKHRGRKLSIPALDGLRPTSDRVRETLFNWLQFELAGMSVVDLFAGTGALGLEALSRGAKQVDFVEPQRLAAQGIQQSLSVLAETEAQVHIKTAQAFLLEQPTKVDLIFVDPPFALGLWDQTLSALVEQDCLNNGGYVYLESPKTQPINLPNGFVVVKDKTAGNVRFQLLQLRSSS
ncbi:16S rRNA (guanine(966)-N(2))-methyltransferase RsmD [Reinekea thalattae]|uniref:Ribosomal RNA small subunit methyltransferase D n=1 Tax=Reinekea thalattae TaxID=2593301 RepID=A0A5C8Z3T6_9GAMM|nr:16S rRNA (guanine(966)-N(2))-methyltransferase RsmD [Reinekea thalattae]TXR51841.1 16S rRNA (guanine(966)-N(2))-methyltransferase RsmD [Reinekea thalattae]